ncbi:hypothetical protein GDO86_012058 [Hymenochirus boettgeri]|uniref:Uncharacterized protein n=1 Tax=Hymenochirus boettgeri TaxID=247094 RepID=A0A8T2JGR5_9PIPI|nr:hypothetical protein GDO86_012058 [Hymenochirus boettgeri]
MSKPLPSSLYLYYPYVSVIPHWLSTFTAGDYRWTFGRLHFFCIYWASGVFSYIYIYISWGTVRVGFTLYHVYTYWFLVMFNKTHVLPM